MKLKHFIQEPRRTLTPKNVTDVSSTRFSVGRMLVTFCLLTAALRYPAAAQYSADWHTIDGGGGIRSGGGYRLRGTGSSLPSGSLAGVPSQSSSVAV